MAGPISGPGSQAEGTPSKKQDAAPKELDSKTDQAAKDAMETAASAAACGLTAEIKNLSLSPSQQDLSYSEIVDNFIEKLRGCGWSGDATWLKRSIIQNDRLDFYGSSLTSLPPEIGNLWKLKSLDLSYTRITTLPPEIKNLCNLQRLALNSTQIVTLPSEIENLLELQHLMLSNTSITSLPPEAGNLSNLQSLHLRGTSITTLPDAIKDLRQLTLLNLTGCPIVAQGDGTNLGRRELKAHFGDRVVFSDTINMQMLSHTTDASKTAASAAANTDITKLTENIKNISLSVSQPNLSYKEIVDNFIEKLKKCGFDGDARKLKKSIILDGVLDLDRAPITSLPPEIGLLSNLRVLVLNNTQITTLPPEIGKLLKMETLYFFNTPIATLPPEIGNLCNLTDLNFHTTLIATLPPEIGNLKKLRTLISSHTLITTLPLEFGNLCNLENLSLGSTRIASLPPEFGNLKKLRTLILSSTLITTLPPEFGNLCNLESLNLDSARIATLPPEIGNLLNLQYLTLDNTLITTLPPEISKLSYLQALWLRCLRITDLPPEIGHLRYLRTLHLGTSITTLPLWIGNLSNLRRLQLGYTRITTLPRAIKELRQITELDLTGCPIVAQGDETNLGRRELRAHFGDRVIFGDVTPATMPSSTTKEEVYRALDSRSIHVNRERLKSATLPEIPDTTIGGGGEFLEQFNRVISQLNFDNETASDYLSHELLANDYASDARGSSASNWEKIRSNVILRLTGYFKTLYDLPLESELGETIGWQMNDDKKPALKKALSYILDQLSSLEDREQRAMLFTQFVHGMLHCPTGQKEGIDTVIIALLDAKTQRASDIETQVHNILAIKKAEFFKTAILTKGAENSQNVHLISTYERLLKEELGLSNILAYEERMGIMGSDPFNNNPYNVLKIFYDLVTPERMVQWLLEKVESSQELALHKELGELEKKRAQFTAKKTWEARLAAAPVEQHAEIQAQIARSQQVSGVDVSDEILQLKAKIKINEQFKPITTQAILTYLTDKKIVDTTQDTWWQEYFSADPAVDETAALTHRGAMALLTKLGYAICL